MTWTHIQNAHIFAPEDLGIQNLTLWNRHILTIGTSPPPDVPVETIGANGCPLLPGFIDPHVHIMGASGVGGPTNRTPDQPISRLTRAGITTVVSPLGTDSLSRTITSLLMRAEAATAEGVSAYVYTGGWRNPIPTLTGDPQTDVTFLARVLGIKVAIAEPTAPPISVSELAHLAHAAVIGGRFASKNAVLHAHIGDRPEGLTPLWDAQRQSGLPADRFVATHINRNPTLFEQAIDFAKAGGSIDVTGQIQIARGYPQAMLAVDAILKLLNANTPFNRITLSTDSGGAYHLQGETRQRMAEPETMWQTVQTLHKTGLSWTQIAGLASHHAAQLLGLSQKGRIAEGADADLLLLTQNGRLDRVWSQGRLMVKSGETLVKSDYED